jgi:hypothetical protein
MFLTNKESACRAIEKGFWWVFVSRVQSCFTMPFSAFNSCNGFWRLAISLKNKFITITLAVSKGWNVASVDDTLTIRKLYIVRDTLIRLTSSKTSQMT